MQSEAGPRAGAHRMLRESGWLTATLAALLVTFAFEHWVVHRQVILPTLEATGAVLPWMWGALFAPELVIAFVAGWRLRTAAQVAVNAFCAAGLREAFELWLARIGEPGHAPSAAPFSELVFTAPAFGVLYVLVFALASASGRTDEELERSHPGRR